MQRNNVDRRKNQRNPSRIKRDIFPIALTLNLALILGAVSCAESPTQGPLTPGEPAPDPIAVAAQGWNELKIESAIYNNRKLTLSSMAHFHQSLDACLRDARGVLELQPWNELAVLLNEAALVIEKIPYSPPNPIPTLSPAPLPTSGPLPLPTSGPAPVPSPAPSPSPSVTPSPLPTFTARHCFTPEERAPYAVDGPVDLFSPGFRQRLFEVKGNEVCTSINDLEKAKALLTQLNALLTLSVYDDCPESRPRLNASAIE